MDYKKAFYSRLEDCYLGAKIKQAQSHQATLQESKAQDEQANQKAQSDPNTAQSGFTNLLMIKERYFTHIKAHLEVRIKALVGDDGIETNNIYNKLYTFFDSYLNETGTPFFTDTPIYKNIYAKIYSNSKDTSLFYKTQNLYYVKSDTLYQSLILQSNTGKFSLYFDASEFKQNADNNKNKVIFKFDDISFVSASKQDEKSAFENSSENSILQITIKVSNQKDLFPNLSAVFKSNSNEFSDEFLKALSQRQIISKKPTQSELDELKKLFRAYKKQNEIDFFIHKDALGFLKEQFDLWMFSYLYKDSEFQEWSALAIKRLQMIKNLAYELIEFIAKFENELKAIWLKPKFAKNTQYVFSIDTILSKAYKDSPTLAEGDRGRVDKLNTLLECIFSDSHFKSQITEWKELNLVDEDFSKKDILQNEKYKFLPIDTKHLSKENKFALLNAFENLETLLNGELIKSDNFQALNTLMPKYQGKIDLIYIDPPFNTGSDFEYKDKFQDSTWLSLMENRLELAKNLLSDKGSFYLHLDHNANYRGRELLNSIFGEENFRNEIVWAYRSGGASKKESMPRKHDNVWLYAKSDDFCINPLYERQYYEINFMNSCKQDDDGRFYADTLLRDILEGDIKIVQGKFLKEYSVKPVLNLSAEHLGFGTQKPEGLLNLLFDIAGSNEDSIILDFFAGSGTTCAVALKLGRKFLGVEMGEHFYKVVIPRLKKVIAGFQSGISKETEYKGGGAFRYYELESYEEALLNCEYVLKEPHPKSLPQGEGVYSPSLAEGDKGGGYSIIDYRKSRKLIKELNKEPNKPVTLNMSGYRAEFDIFQTIANLMGWKIKRLFLDKSTHPLTPSAREGEHLGIEACEYDNGEVLNVQSIDIAKYPKLKNLIFWNKE